MFGKSRKLDPLEKSFVSSWFVHLVPIFLQILQQEEMFYRERKGKGFVGFILTCRNQIWVCRFPFIFYFLSIVNIKLKKVKYKLTFFLHIHQIVNYHGSMLEELYLVYLIASYQVCSHKIKPIWSVGLVLFC